MGRIVAVFLVFLSACALAAPAQAERRLVAPVEAIAAPAIAGDSVAYVSLNAQRRSELRVATPDGASHLLATLGEWKLPDPFDAYNDFTELDTQVVGSQYGVAALQTTLSHTRYNTTASAAKLFAGQLSGPVTALASRCIYEAPGATPHVDVDGPRLVYVSEKCDGRAKEWKLSIRDLRTGAEEPGPATRGPKVSLAGRYLAYEPVGEAGTIAVRNVNTGDDLYTVQAADGNDMGLHAFDVQADGKLAALAWDYKRRCMRVQWFSPKEDGPQPLGCAAWNDIALDENRLALTGNGGLFIATLGGKTVQWPLQAPLAGGVDLDGDRMAYSTVGCSSGTGAIWLEDLTGDPNTSRAAPPPPCTLRLRERGTLKVDRKYRTKVTISCPNGCRGGAEVTYRGWPVGGPKKAFELKAGESRKLSLAIDSNITPLNKGRKVHAVVHLRIDGRDRATDVVRKLTLLRPKR